MEFIANICSVIKVIGSFFLLPWHRCCTLEKLKSLIRHETCFCIYYNLLLFIYFVLEQIKKILFHSPPCVLVCITNLLTLLAEFYRRRNEGEKITKKLIKKSQHIYSGKRHFLNCLSVQYNCSVF